MALPLSLLLSLPVLPVAVNADARKAVTKDKVRRPRAKASPILLFSGIITYRHIGIIGVDGMAFIENKC